MQPRPCPPIAVGLGTYDRVRAISFARGVSQVAVISPAIERALDAAGAPQSPDPATHRRALRRALVEEGTIVMAKKQTRRSISISKKKYEALAAYSKQTGHSMSQLAEVGIGLAIDCGARPSMPTPTVETL